VPFHESFSFLRQAKGDPIRIPAVKGHSIWLLPEKQAFEYYQAVIHRLAKEAATPIFGPHITLLGQIPGPVNQIQKSLEKLLNDRKAFDLELDQIELSDTFYRSIILLVKENAELEQLYTRSLDRFNMVDKEIFVPHLSLLYSHLSRERKMELLRDVEIPLPALIKITDVVLMQTMGGPLEWVEVSRISLK